MMREAWQVELEPGRWLIGALGSNTDHQDHGRVYATEHGARTALGIDRSWRRKWHYAGTGVDRKHWTHNPWPKARVVPVSVGPECPLYDQLEEWRREEKQVHD